MTRLFSINATGLGDNLKAILKMSYGKSVGKEIYSN